ncbi:MAG TPA: ATP-binding protein [Polyangiaceae bacterium]|nr:ATP-binding protein [Polyangiaceae bacterium]
MKSLYFRILVGMWLTMTIIVGIFAAIHALTFPDTDTRRRALVARSMDLRSEKALDCAVAARTACDTPLKPIDERDQRLAIYRDGKVVLGDPIEGADEITRAARAAGGSAIEQSGGWDVSALIKDRGASGEYVVVGRQARPSRWMFFIVPETLPWRLLAIVIVTGLVSVFLARYLTRPIQTLRGAAEKLAKGDLDVRVTGQLDGADSETLALGEEMDRMAERIQDLLESQRRLLRDVSHELRSPLARLNLALELVRRQSPKEATTALDRIEREAERLSAMIGELLTLSRLESGAAIERPETVDLSELVGEIAADVGFEAEQKGASIELHVEPSLDVRGNPELLRRAIENVLRNALRFTESGSRVQVELEGDRAGLELRVRDHGPGVPEDALEQIFKPFYRVSDDRARQTGGVGIGLAITHGAVAAHGGSIAAKNAKGGGLLVQMRLPRAKAVAAG